MSRVLATATTALLLLAGGAALGQAVFGFAGWVWTAMGVGAVGSGLVWLTVWLWQRTPLSQRWLLLLLVVGVLVRVLALPTDRYVSDDAFRYHWDGKVLVHGINPYRYPPDDPALDALRTDALDAHVNHPSVRTVYPPFAPLLFATGYLLTPGSLLGLQLLVLLGELAAWALLLLELSRRRLPPIQVLLLAWSPLVLVEAYLPGHLDALALPWLALFLVALSRRRVALAGVSLALACLIKPWPLIFGPVLLRELGGRRTAWLALVAALVGAAFYAVFASAGWHLFSSMWLMAQKWANNASLVALLQQGLEPGTARLVAAVLLLMGASAAAFYPTDLRGRLLLAFTAFVICTPNLFPWYLLAALPLLVLRPDPALLTLLALAPFTETVNIDWRLHGVWHPPAWPIWAMYVPFYLLLGIGAWRRWGMFAPASRVEVPAARGAAGRATPATP